MSVVDTYTDLLLFNRGGRRAKIKLCALRDLCG